MLYVRSHPNGLKWDENGKLWLYKLVFVMNIDLKALMYQVYALKFIPKSTFIHATVASISLKFSYRSYTKFDL